MQALMLNTECPPAGLRLYDVQRGQLLLKQALPGGGAGGAFSFDVGAVGLAAGTYQLGVAAVNAYRCEGPLALVTVEIDAGGQVGALIDAQRVTAEAMAGGEVAVRWEAYRPIGEDSERTEPAEFEVAETGDLGAVLATVAYSRTGFHGADLGPYADGVSKTFAVRSSDGEVGGLRGVWVAADAVVADAAGPDVPVIDEDLLPEGCGCG